ncbi:pilus assembly FimT family protein [Geotalea toluenoxydans]|uniref:pilus assembly FimT family protein n=1 Tax=Geotalea toluenoxydans TaxID=421624 RepID=UPI0006D15FB4|nr:type II secretion system protein [Geotalea toluenoxydans]
MHDDHGFTLVELIVVMAVMGILLSLGTMAFNEYSKKTAIESQVKTMYADLMALRAEAFYQKQKRAAVISGNEFLIYATENTSDTPVERKKLSYPVVSNNGDTIIIDSSGLLNASGIDGKSICVNVGENGAVVDSLVLSTSRIHLGKWLTPGGVAGDCKGHKDYIKRQ